jgi:AcrR family transcriptional regulator
MKDRLNVRGVSTRRNLIDAAERLLARRGVDSVSTREIAAAAGMANHSAIRHHFKTKDELVRAVLRDRAGGIENRRAAIIATRPEPLSVDDAIDAIISPLAEYQAATGPQSFYFRFLEQTTRFFGFAATVAEMERAPSLSHCIKALSGQRPEPEDDMRAAIVLGTIFRAFADREQALEEGLRFSDDVGFVSLLTAAAASIARL